MELSEDYRKDYLKVEKEEFVEARKLSTWKKKPFYDDAWIFNDMEYEDIIGDLFESVKEIRKPSKTDILKRLRKARAINIKAKGRWNRNLDKQLVIMITNKMNKEWCKKNDRFIDMQIKANCLRAVPKRTNFEEGMTAANSTKFFRQAAARDFAEQKGSDRKYKGEQLSRMIFEDCSYSNGQVRLPQLLSPGTCNIPSHLREENIAKFAGITLKQAKTISKIYRIIGISFSLAIKVNRLIRKRSQLTEPWEIKLTTRGLTLLELAKNLKEVDESHQQFIDHDTCDFLGDKFCEVDDIAANWDADSDPKKEEHDRLYKQENTVNEYSYWNNSIIPKAGHLAGRHRRAFMKIMQAAKEGRVTVSNFKNIKRWVNKKANFAQKAKFKSVCILKKAS